MDDNTTAQGAGQVNQAPNPADATQQANQSGTEQNQVQNQNTKPAEAQPSSFTEEIGQTQQPSDSRSGSYKAGQDSMAPVIAEKNAEIERLKAQVASQGQPQVQPQVQPQQPQTVQPQADDSLKRDVENIKYMQQREIQVSSHVMGKPDDARVRAEVMALASQSAYKDLPTADLFVIANAKNPAPQSVPEQPTAQQPSIQSPNVNAQVPGTQQGQDTPEAIKARINQARTQAAQAAGVQPDLLR